jgi:plastocyanin
VRLRRGLVFLLAASLGAAVIVLPAVASSEASPAVEAVNSPGPYGEQHHAWSLTPPLITIDPGAVVTFANNSATVPHGVVWSGGPETPKCAGVPIGSGMTSWNGTCTFSVAGTYTFHCYVHPAEMQGTITVSAGGATTTTTTTQPTAGGPATTVPGVSGGSLSPTTLGSAAPSGSPLAGDAATAVKLSPLQRGPSVRGSVAVSESGAGGRLEVDLLARSASLAAHRASRVRVGRLLRSALHAGVLPFSVALDARGRRALHTRRRLALTVRLVLTPPQGAARSVVRSVVLHS